MSGEAKHAKHLMLPFALLSDELKDLPYKNINAQRT